MSDNSIYAKLVSTISVALTNKGIKLHIPGILSIICPAYGAMRLYDGKKLEETSLEELQEKQKTVEPIITSSKPQFYKLKQDVNISLHIPIKKELIIQNIKI